MAAETRVMRHFRMDMVSISPSRIFVSDNRRSMTPIQYPAIIKQQQMTAGFSLLNYLLLNCKIVAIVLFRVQTNSWVFVPLASKNQLSSWPLNRRTFVFACFQPTHYLQTSRLKPNARYCRMLFVHLKSVFQKQHIFSSAHYYYENCLCHRQLASFEVVQWHPGYGPLAFGLRMLVKTYVLIIRTAVY